MLILEGEKKNLYFQKRSIFTTASAPVFTMSDREPAGSKKESLLVSLPMYMKLSGYTAEEVMYERVLIKMKDEDNYDDYDTVVQALKSQFTSF